MHSAPEGLSADEKRRIMETLERDREFRYALMGLLGFREILDRITRLEEGQQRLEERFAELERRFAELAERQQRLEERFARLEERVARLEERFAELEERVTRLEERFAQLEERFAELEERFAKLEERVVRLEERFAQLEEKFARLEERQQRLEERQSRLEREMLETRRLLLAIAHRYGVITEEAFREAMKYVVEETLGVARVERWVYRDDEGFVYGEPSIVEVDLVIRDGVHFLVEVKSRVSRSDVAEIYRIGELYARVEGVRPRLVILGGLIDKSAVELARRLDVEVRPIASL